MIRPRNLAIAPILSIGAVTAILIAAAFSFRAAIANEPVIVVNDVSPVLQDIVGPAIPNRILTLETFPDHYEGHFLWDGQAYEDHQWTGLDVEDKSVVGELIIATGRGTYSDDAGDTDFTFRIEANPQTGEWTMWESEPEIAANFVTEGRHEATFVDDVLNVSARWIGDNGMNGRLVLRATRTSVRTSNVDQRFFEPAPAHARFLNGGVRLEKRYTGDGIDCVANGSDRVTVHYSGWNTEGVFDDSWKRGRPATFKPTQVIAGWQTALFDLCEGDFARVWIPADQAYGDPARPGAPAGDLIFDIEVINIEH